MGLITGVISCVIAAIKHRTVFAWITGIWTGIALILVLAGSTQYAIAPGYLFLVIAICMKKDTSVVDGNEAKATIKSDPKDTSKDDHYAQKDDRYAQLKQFEKLIGEGENSFFHTIKTCKSVDDIFTIVKIYSSPFPLLFSDGFLSSMREYLQEQETICDDLRVAAVNYFKESFSHTEENESMVVVLQTNEKKHADVCPTCGAQLREKAKYCPYCCTEVETNIIASQDAKYCRKCGERLLDNSSFCRKCGTPVITQNMIELPVIPQSDTKIPTESDGKRLPENIQISEPIKPSVSINFMDKKLHPKTRRGFLFLEDEEWERADQYFEAVLDEDPTDAYAYLGKAMLELRICQLSEISSKRMTVKENRFFQKAVRFATEELKNQLNNL